MKSHLLGVFFFLLFSSSIQAQNVGVGVASPLSRLHIVNPDTPKAMQIDVTNALNDRSALEVNQAGIGKGIRINMNNASSFQLGVDVRHAGNGTGVYASISSESGTAIAGDNLSGNAIVGISGGAAGTSAVAGRADNDGNGVYGWNTNNGIGVSALANGSALAGKFRVNNLNGTQNAIEITGNHKGQGIDIQLTNASNGSRAINIIHAGTGSGLLASTTGNAVWGICSNGGYAGVLGDNLTGEAVVGRSRGATGAGAVVGRNDSSGYGVRGFNTKTGIGVLGQNGVSGGTGVAGRFENLNSANGSNVLEVVNASNATGYAIFATQSSNFGTTVRVLNNGSGGTGIYGLANTGTAAYGIWGVSSSGYGGYFSGNVQVVGTLSKSAGTFKIDHPLDPANKYLIHSFVESPDMLNIYNGNVTTGADGRAMVELPSYFEAENIDFRYQLTILDATRFARARVSKKIQGNRFEIMTDEPNVEVSWMVTGIRNDAYARMHRVVPEREKEADYKGLYLNPIEHSMPLERGIDYQRMKKAGLLDNHEGPAIIGTPKTNTVSSMPVTAPE